MISIHELERTETRALAALRCVDAITRVAVDTALAVEVAHSTVRRNRSGLYVITSCTALPGHDTEFLAPPASPPAGSLSLRAVLRDPSGHYLARSASISLPRDADPARAAQPSSLFQPVELALYRTSAAATEANWSVLRVTVALAASGDALGGALLRVLDGSKVLARGMTDWRGEALVAVAGIPANTWSGDPPAAVALRVRAQLEVTVDVGALQRAAMSNVRQGIVPADGPPPDPDRLEAASGAGFYRQRVDVELATGGKQSVSIAVALP